MNGAIGIVRNIVFENSNRHREQDDAIPSYVILKFPNSIIPNANKYFQNQGPN